MACRRQETKGAGVHFKGNEKPKQKRVSEDPKWCPRKADADNIENHDADESTKVVKRKTLNAIPLQQFEVRKIRNKSGREATVGNVG